jgi:hypothetical protein
MFASFFPYYLKWHYTDGFTGFLGIWKNFFLFIQNLFSISSLLKTLFSGWHRIRESYPRGFDIGEFFSALAVNFIMIIFGFLVKIFFIIIGIISLLFIGVAGLVLLIGWLVLPFIVATFLFFGLVKIF